MPPSAAMSPLEPSPTRAALHRLATTAPSVAAAHAPLPLFLRAPYIGALWALSLFIAMTALALGRIRLPLVASGVAVAMQPAADSTMLLLLLPSSARAHLRPGQRVSLDTGADTIALTVASVDSALLDAAAARRRFLEPASLLTYLVEPKLVAHLYRCAGERCLTVTPGVSYPAVAALGTRTAASYALPRS